ncbi:DUF6894 family protein [Methylobacterium segetis]|uniref:DUF6894 family protein n=1 Tax=Methylobacterium segetis TaxID=2488750 RepID=UPI001045F931|nr:hypothetical protein [Methylobacterium segetis]
MPRFFFDTFDGLVVFDDEGTDLPDRAAARRHAHRALSDMMQSAPDRGSTVQYRADVRDAQNRRIMTATISFAIDETD